MYTSDALAPADPPALDVTADLRYLPSSTVRQYHARMLREHPDTADLLDLETPPARAALARLATTETEFDSDEVGRGDAYRLAQADASVRWTGIRELLHLAAPGPRPARVLDVFGGDGLLARAARTFGDGTLRQVDVLTGDLSGVMVDHALAKGLPAVRQSADALLLRDETVDGVLMAYGTHHLAVDRRATSVAEAARVCRTGGAVVVHDFDQHSPMARFFTEVVDEFAVAGHAYQHFTRAHLREIFADAGLIVRISDLYDPLVTTANTADLARHRMCRYVGRMYGVSAWLAAQGGPDAAWEALVRRFDHRRYGPLRSFPPDVPDRPRVHRPGVGYTAVVPRIALVAIARKER